MKQQIKEDVGHATVAEPGKRTRLKSEGRYDFIRVQTSGNNRVNLPSVAVPLFFYESNNLFKPATCYGS